MNYREIFSKMTAVLRKYRSILVYIKGSPDPDAIASSYAIMQLCGLLGIRADIAAAMEPSLPQNRAILRKLDIPLKYVKNAEELADYDAYVVTDFQSAQVKGLSGKMPCALHIDHHEEIDEEVKADLKVIGANAGSVSSMIALAIKESDYRDKEKLLAEAGTALVLGIQTDTDNFRHAGEDDFQALAFLAPYSDKKIINEISGIPFSDETIALLKKARNGKTAYKDWLIAGVGFISEKHRDSIAIIADLLLSEEDCSTAVVFALVEKNGGKNLVLDASFRTRDSDLDLDFLIKQITAEGGGRKFKGAYQVNLDYFTQCPDRDLLWELVEKTTAGVLTRMRDDIHIIELKGFYRNMKKKLTSMFRGPALMFIALAVAAGSFSCTKKFGMVRGIRPAERSDVEVIKKHECALIRHRDFDIAAQEIGLGGWVKLLEHEIFLRKKGNTEARIPRLNFFHIVISNQGRNPVKIEQMSVRFGDNEIAALSTEAVLDKCKSPAYAAINMKSLLGLKRYLGDKWCVEEIDYTASVIDYNFDVIAPGDSVIKIVAFDWIPVQFRDLKLLVKVRNAGEEKQKIVDFDFKRLEFRTKGRHFINTKDISPD